MKVKNVSKHKQSAIAKAAYVSNEALYSERDEETKKYKTRGIKPESFILAPTHAPSFVFDRQKLWNEAEKVEKQFNARVMKEIVVALPIELSDSQQTELTKKFVQEVLVADGMVADVSIHRDQEHNPHAHILLTVRPFNDDGTWFKNKSKKEYILDPNGEKIKNENGDYKTRNVDLTGWTKKETLLQWREHFAQMTNDFYKNNNINESVSHLSYEEQGLDKLPKQRLTRNEFYIEKQAEKKAVEDGREYVPVTHYGTLNKQIEEYNEEIEMIESKIISLEEYKERKSPINYQEFNDIRKNFNVNEEYREAVQFVENRAKTDFVDYEIARNTMDSIEYWKMSIDRKNRMFDIERNVLKSALNNYEKKSTTLFKLGFVQEDFSGQYNPKAMSLDLNYKKLSSEFEGYHEAFNFTNKVLEIQTTLMRKEFVYLYPDYAEIAVIDSLENNQIMNKYVTDYKENLKIHLVIPEYEQSEIFGTKEEHIFRADVWKVVLDYRNESKQYFSLSKRMESADQNYKDTVSDYKETIEVSIESKEKIYKSAVGYLTAKNEMEHLSNRYDKTKSIMYDSLIELYGHEQSSVIQKLPDRIKVTLLENYLKDRSVNELKDDLAEVKWSIKGKRISDDGNYGDSHTQFEQSSASGKAIGNILSDLIEQAKQNGISSDNNESKLKRAKRKRKKLTKEDLLEHEN